MIKNLTAASAFLLALGASGAQADLLDTIKERGELVCGTLDYLPGVGFLNDKGEWSGFDVEFCQAAAAAILGDPSKVKYVPTTGANKFPVLESGEIDILSRSVTMTIARDTTLNMDFIGPNNLSGQGFMVHAATGVTKPEELDGATICVLSGTTTERILAEWFRARDLSFSPVAAENSDQMFSMYFDNRCDAVTMEPPYLAIRRLRMGDESDHTILDGIITKSFEAPVIMEGNPKLRDALQWMHWGMITAEEMGITQDNVEEMAKTSQDPAVRRFLGVEDTIGEDMGVPNDWMVAVIKAVGNFGEFYDRNLGMNSVLKVGRGLNALVRDGGALTAPSWQ